MMDKQDEDLLDTFISTIYKYAKFKPQAIAENACELEFYHNYETNMHVYTFKIANSVTSTYTINPLDQQDISLLDYLLSLFEGTVQNSAVKLYERDIEYWSIL